MAHTTYGAVFALIWVFCMLPHLAHGAGAQLIFRSGFEPNTSGTVDPELYADIVGTDNSVSAPNDWVNDLDG